jgi:hypothetical protein
MEDSMSNKASKKWSEMPTSRKVFIVLMTIAQFTLLAFALADIRKRPAEQINGSKKLWTAIAFINWIGPIAYFVKGRKQIPADEVPWAA